MFTMYIYILYPPRSGQRLLQDVPPRFAKSSKLSSDAAVFMPQVGWDPYPMKIAFDQQTVCNMLNMDNF